MARDLGEAKREAVAKYFSGVLTMLRYPSDFPTGAQVAHLPTDHELRIDIDLPLMAAIPELEPAECLVTTKELRYNKLPAAARNKLYQQVVAQMTLPTLRYVFAADREVSSSKPPATATSTPSTPQRARTRPGAWSACRSPVMSSSAWMAHACLSGSPGEYVAKIRHSRHRGR